MIKKTMEFHDSGVKPVRASGTRWIAHKVSAMKRIVDKYGVYVQHLCLVGYKLQGERTGQNTGILKKLENWQNADTLMLLP